MATMVKIDRFGKIFLPKQVRSRVHATQFEVKIMNDELHLIPVKDPSQLFGSLPADSNAKESLEEIHDDDHDLSA
jgi:hypothetical protein